MPILSLVICSRNDNYLGNSLHRLQTCLNYLALQVTSLDRAYDVEVIVTDWGSDIPLRQTLALTQDATRITRFLEIPPAIARDKQRDSPFAEVIANNAAIRRARGMYIGRIDQDTLVGRRFLHRFFEQVDRGRDSSVAFDSGFLFVGRRHVPLGFVRESPSLDIVVSYIEALGSVLPRDGVGQRPWFDAPVGVLMMHRDLWHECRGYDERLLYWGFMETDLGLRIGRRHTVINVAPVLGRDVFHLSHAMQRFKVTSRRKNARAMPQTFAPNDQSWGLVQYKLKLHTANPSEGASETFTKPGRSKWNLRASYGVDVIRECLWEAGLTGARCCRTLVLGDRIQPAPKPSEAAPMKEVVP